MKNKIKSDKRSYILTKETFGMTLMLFSALVTIMLLSCRLVFGGIGGAVCTFMYGTFGYGSYFIMFLLAYLGEWMTFEKKLKIDKKLAICVSATVFMLIMLFHAVSTAGYESETFGKYISDCYFNAAKGYSGFTAGGVFSGLLIYPITKGITYTGAYVVFSILAVLFGALTALVIRNLVRNNKNAGVRVTETSDDGFNETVDESEFESEEIKEEYVAPAESVPQSKPVAAAVAESEAPVDDEDKFSPENLGRRILFEPGEFAAESYRRNMIYNENSYFNHPVQNDGDYLSSFSDGTKKPAQPAAEQQTYTSDYSSQVERGDAGTSAPSYIYGDSPAENLGEQSQQTSPYSSYTVNEEQPRVEPKREPETYVRPEDVQPRESYEPRQPVQPVQPVQPRDSYEPRQPVQPVQSQDTYESRQSVQRDYYSQPQSESVERRIVPDVQPQPEEPDDDMTDSDFNGSAEDTYRQPEETAFQQPLAREEPPAQQRGSGLFSLFSSSNPRLNEQQSRVEPDVSAMQSARGERSRENLFDEEESEEDNLFGDQSPLVSRTPTFDDGVRQSETGFRERRGLTDIGGTDESYVEEQPVVPVAPVRNVEPAPVRPVEQPKPVVEEKPKHVWKKYIRPSLELLDDYPENNNVNTGEIEESKRIIVETLASFRIASQVANVVVGPAITRYDVIIEDKTNIKNALKYREAVAMALMKENVTAYLNYSKGAISIEVPNSSRTTVGLKGMLASSQFINAKPNSLTFTLGKNVEGQVVCPDITKMPHLLVAGTTGSGKSICLSTLIVSLLYKYGPEELRFILVDPKQVEFISYDKLPHLMINEIIYDIDKAIKALNWAIKEMERRYALFKEMTEKGVATKSLNEYNAHLPEGEEKLPKIVIILDEFGDLMLQAKKEIESRIIRLVQKARACGIHLILATQRPSVDCITGLIKSNLPTRIGFKVNSFDDARCIFDIGGAEKLLGKGDLYYRSADNPELARIQGCFIDTHEVQRVTDFIKEHNETYFDQSVSDFINTVEEEQTEAAADDGGASGDSTRVDDTFIKALKFCVTSNQASVSMIQRRFPIGYMKACKIIDWMETMNYITQSEGSKPRKVLLSREEFIQKYGDVDD